MRFYFIQSEYSRSKTPFAYQRSHGTFEAIGSSCCIVVLQLFYGCCTVVCSCVIYSENDCEHVTQPKNERRAFSNFLILYPLLRFPFLLFSAFRCHSCCTVVVSQRCSTRSSTNPWHIVVIQQLSSCSTTVVTGRFSTTNPLDTVHCSPLSVLLSSVFLKNSNEQ